MFFFRVDATGCGCGCGCDGKWVSGGDQAADDLFRGVGGVKNGVLRMGKTKK